jgi:hypothetical protein
VASSKTALTELATAVGLFWDPSDEWPTSVESIEVPGIERTTWLPVLAPALVTGGRDRPLLLTALENGRCFRHQVLHGRAPARVEWSGNDKSLWPSEVPRDLTVDEVWFIQAKHDSTCVLNTSPSAVFELLLFDTEAVSHESWYEHVAPLELQAYYESVRASTAPGQLPAQVGRLDREGRRLLKQVMRARGAPTADEEAAYAQLTDAVSRRTAHHWQARLARATPGQRTRLLLRMLRVAGGPYWLLGSRGAEPLRLRVCDTRQWRQRFELRSFQAEPAGAGQPQVNWVAQVVDRSTRAGIEVHGFCEVRWSHGKLQGSPECKVQVTTPHAALPGYDPLPG